MAKTAFKSLVTVIIIIYLTVSLSAAQATNKVITNRALFDAVEKNNYKKLKELIEQGADINAKNQSEWTILHIASRDGYQEIVKLLLNSGANVNIIDETGTTPLHLAAINEQKYIIKLLLQSNVVVNQKDIYENTPLDYAIGDNNEVREILIQAGARQNSKSEMIVAVVKNDVVRVKYFLKQGIGPNIADNFGKSLLYKACERRYVKIVRLLLEAGAINDYVKPAIQPTPLHIAAKKGYKKIIKIMVDLGVDINSPMFITLGRGGSVTPLDYAKNKEIRNFMIKLGGLPGEQDGEE